MKYKTTVDAGHRHYWEPGKKYTTANSGHKHKINQSKKLALPVKPGQHNHKLTKEKK